MESYTASLGCFAVCLHNVSGVQSAQEHAGVRHSLWGIYNRSGTTGGIDEHRSGRLG